MMKVANLADEPCGQELLTERLLIKFEVRDTGIGISKEKLKLTQISSLNLSQISLCEKLQMDCG
jgi:hypothetical protein